jgi:hypothetical protein
MKQQLVVFAALVALALSGLLVAEAQSATPGEERGWVDASGSTNSLVEKGLVTPHEEKTLRHPMGAPPVDERAMQKYFDTPPYRREGWRGGP